MTEIVLNKGLEPFDIYFKDIDEHAIIYFNPSDSDLPKRLVECQKIIEEKTKNIKEYEIDEDGNPVAESCVKCFDEANTIICDALDYAFGNKISDVVFKHCGALSIVNGNYQVLNFLEAITPAVEQVVKRNQKAVSAKMDKYLKKYKK